MRKLLNHKVKNLLKYQQIFMYQIFVQFVTII